MHLIADQRKPSGVVIFFKSLSLSRFEGSLVSTLERDLKNGVMILLLKLLHKHKEHRISIMALQSSLSEANSFESGSLADPVCFYLMQSAQQFCG